MATVLELEGCQVILDRALVVPDERALTTREVELLQYLSERPDETVTREELLREVWGYAEGVVSRTLDTTVRRLRKKIEVDPKRPRHVLTVYGTGYRFVPLAPVERRVDPELIGREAELQRLAALLDSDGLVAVIGPGGVGKTRLCRALVAGRTVVEMVELEAVRRPNELREAVALALDVVFDSVEPVERDEQLARALLARPELTLVLDNFEQLLPDGASLPQAWHRSGGARIVITSRTRLGVGEALLRLSPMSPDDAVTLFEKRAGKVLPEADLQAQRDVVRSLCEALDGLPLSIELAAARVSLLSPSELRDRIDRHLDLLGGRADTLRQMVAWSWDLLEPRQQEALQAAAVFRGGFGLDALARVVGREITDDLRALVDASLVQVTVQPSDSGLPDRRFSLLASVRAFVLETEGDWGALRRHGEWVVALCEEHADLGAGIRTLSGLETLDAELGNIEVASEADTLDGWQARITLALLLRERGDAHGEHRVLSRGGDGDGPRAARLRIWQGLHRSLELASHRSTEERLAILDALEPVDDVTAAWIAFARAYQHPPSERLPIARRAAEEFAALGLPYGEGLARRQAGSACRGLLRAEEGVEHLERVLTLLPVDALLRFNVLRALGDLEDLRGHRARARRYLLEAADFAQRGNNPLNEASARIFLSLFALSEFEVPSALAEGEAAVRLVERVGSSKGMAAVLGNFAIVLREIGELDRAEALFWSSNEIFERERRSLHALMGEQNIAQVWRERGDLDDAEVVFRRCLERLPEGNRVSEALVYGDLGLIACLRGEDGREDLRRSVEGLPDDLAYECLEARSQLALACALQGEWEDARHWLAEAEAVHCPRLVGQALVKLCRGLREPDSIPERIRDARRPASHGWSVADSYCAVRVAISLLERVTP